MELVILETKETDVFLNLALEHAILENLVQNSGPATVRLWRNDKSVIVGRGQHLKLEVDLDYCSQNHIQVARRISGGGTVFQDLGNINISYFLPPSLKRKLKIKDLGSMAQRMSNLLINSLQLIGYENLQIEYDSNILFEDMKISGSAGYMMKNWNLHHCTLLTSTDISMLNQSILARDKQPKNKRQSRYFETKNLQKFDYEQWKIQFIKVLEETTGYTVGFEELSEQIITRANELLSNLYSQYDWIYSGKRK